MNADRLQNLMLLNTNKDILDTIDSRVQVLVKKWFHLKHRRIKYKKLINNLKCYNKKCIENKMLSDIIYSCFWITLL